MNKQELIEILKNAGRNEENEIEILEEEMDKFSSDVEEIKEELFGIGYEAKLHLGEYGVWVIREMTDEEINENNEKAEKEVYEYFLNKMSGQLTKEEFNK